MLLGEVIDYTHEEGHGPLCKVVSANIDAEGEFELARFDYKRQAAPLEDVEDRLWEAQKDPGSDHCFTLMAAFGREEDCEADYHTQSTADYNVLSVPEFVCKITQRDEGEEGNEVGQGVALG